MSRAPPDAGGAASGGAARSASGEEPPLRGTVMALEMGVASLPTAGMGQVRLGQHNTAARMYQKQYRSRTLRLAEELGKEENPRCYMDPGLRRRAPMLGFAVMLYLSGMLGMTSTCVETVSVFFVFKKVLESGAWSLRPVWDLRGVNQHFSVPPKFALGAMAAWSDVELSPEVRAGRVLWSTRGDVPEFFHRCLTEEELWPYFVLPGISAMDL